MKLKVIIGIMTAFGMSVALADDFQPLNDVNAVVNLASAPSESNPVEAQTADGDTGFTIVDQSGNLQMIERPKAERTSAPGQPPANPIPPNAPVTNVGLMPSAPTGISPGATSPLPVTHTGERPNLIPASEQQKSPNPPPYITVTGPAIPPPAGSVGAPPAYNTNVGTPPQDTSVINPPVRTSVTNNPPVSTTPIGQPSQRSSVASSPNLPGSVTDPSPIPNTPVSPFPAAPSTPNMPSPSSTTTNPPPATEPLTLPNAPAGATVSPPPSNTPVQQPYINPPPMMPPRNY